MPNNPVKHLIDLSDEERHKFEEIVKKGTAKRRLADRARIILWADQGVPIRESAKRLGCVKQTVLNWRKWYLKRRNEEGMGPIEALKDRPRPGRPQDFSP